MKAKLTLIVILMTAIPVLSSAQTKSGADSAPTNPAGAPDSQVPDPGPVPAAPVSPGPQQVLQEYQTVMVVITQNFTANLAGITEPVQEGKNEQRGRQDLNRRAVPHCQDAIPAA